jgi:hypothetical protein
VEEGVLIGDGFQQEGGRGSFTLRAGACGGLLPCPRFAPARAARARPHRNGRGEHAARARKEKGFCIPRARPQPWAKKSNTTIWLWRAWPGHFGPYQTRP